MTHDFKEPRIYCEIWCGPSIIARVNNERNAQVIKEFLERRFPNLAKYEVFRIERVERDEL